MGKFIPPSRDTLHQLYVVEKRGVLGVARALQCRNATALKLLQDDGFIARVTKEWLIEQYVIRERSVDDLATELSCTESNIRYYLRTHKIPIRYKSRGSVRKPVLHDRDWLYDQHIVQDRSIYEIAAITHSAVSSVVIALRRARIRSIHSQHYHRKDRPLYRRNQFTVATRRKILARDGYRCRFPGCEGKSRSLEAHHILPIHLGGKNKEHNGITLCRRCHWKTYGREEELIPTFQSLIQELLT